MTVIGHSAISEKVPESFDKIVIKKFAVESILTLNRHLFNNLSLLLRSNCDIFVILPFVIKVLFKLQFHILVQWSI